MRIPTLGVRTLVVVACCLAAGTPAPAGAEALPLGTPALLSNGQMTPSSTPQLRVVDQALVSRSLEGVKPAWNAALPRPATGLSASHPLRRGMEALARYSSYRVDDSPTPWEEGLPTPMGDLARSGKLRSAGYARDTDLSAGDPAEGALSFSSSLAREPRAGVSWSGPGRSEARSLVADMDGSSSSLVRSVARVATPILEIADALRAVRLNQIRLSDDLTLKLNGRTGRHARCFAILTHRF